MGTKPNIIISETDANRLEALLASLPADAFPARAALEEELDRADIVGSREISPTVVTMNSGAGRGISPVAHPGVARMTGSYSARIARLGD